GGAAERTAFGPDQLRLALRTRPGDYPPHRRLHRPPSGRAAAGRLAVEWRCDAIRAGPAAPGRDLSALGRARDRAAVGAGPFARGVSRSGALWTFAARP